MSVFPTRQRRGCVPGRDCGRAPSRPTAPGVQQRRRGGPDPDGVGSQPVVSVQSVGGQNGETQLVTRVGTASPAGQPAPGQSAPSLAPNCGAPPRRGPSRDPGGEGNASSTHSITYPQGFFKCSARASQPGLSGAGGGGGTCPRQREALGRKGQRGSSEGNGVLCPDCSCKHEQVRFRQHATGSYPFVL